MVIMIPFPNVILQVTKKKTRLDKHSRKMQNMKSAVRNKNPRAVAISIEGRGMNL